MGPSSVLAPESAVQFLLDSLEIAHRREPFVGGLFNAYEIAIHYELFTAALAEGLHDTWQEAPLGNGQTTCDLVFPLQGNDRLWVEVKQWWFLHHAYETPYVNFGKTKGWPLVDWERLASIPSGTQRAVLLLRAWDDDKGKDKANEWLDSLVPLMKQSGAPELPEFRSLKAFTYPGSRSHTRNGDAILWSSTMS